MKGLKNWWDSVVGLVWVPRSPSEGRKASFVLDQKVNWERLVDCGDGWWFFGCDAPIDGICGGRCQGNDQIADDSWRVFVIWDGFWVYWAKSVWWESVSWCVSMTMICSCTALVVHIPFVQNSSKLPFRTVQEQNAVLRCTEQYDFRVLKYRYSNAWNGICIS